MPSSHGAFVASLREEVQQLIDEIKSKCFETSDLKEILGYDILNVIPVIDAKATLPALLIAGFLTSFHCIGMCGAINLAVSKSSRKFLPALFFF